MQTFLYALLLASSPAPVEAAAAPKAEMPVAKQDEGEMICKRYTVIGSRLTNKKVCKTQKEWDEARAENAEVLRRQRGAIGGPQPGNGGG